LEQLLELTSVFVSNAAVRHGVSGLNTAKKKPEPNLENRLPCIALFNKNARAAFFGNPWLA
jgi:hypothetical protein